jgi:drug/metabolite transporter (DMT)-like permease
MTSRAGLAALVVAAACWGATVVLIRFASDQLGVSTLTILDNASAALILLAVLLAQGRRLPRPSARLLLVSALEPGVSYILINYGVAHTSGSHASLIVGTESIFIVAFAAVVNRARPATSTIVGLVLGTAGAALLASSGSSHATLSGDLIVLAGIVSSAGYVVLVQPLAERMNALELTAAQFVYGGMITIPLVGLLSVTGALPPLDWAPTRFILAAVAVGVVGSTIAFALYNWALSKVRPSTSAVSLTLIPVFGLTFSVLLLGDDVSPRLGIAAVAVLAGLTITSRAHVRAGELPVAGATY